MAIQGLGLVRGRVDCFAALAMTRGWPSSRGRRLWRSRGWGLFVAVWIASLRSQWRGGGRHREAEGCGDPGVGACSWPCGLLRCARNDAGVAVIARPKAVAIQGLRLARGRVDCFAALAMTRGWPSSRGRRLWRSRGWGLFVAVWIASLRSQWRGGGRHREAEGCGDPGVGACP